MSPLPLLLLSLALLSAADEAVYNDDELTYVAEDSELLDSETQPEDFYPPGFDVSDLDDIQPYHLHMIDHPDAKCLDGSQSAYYFYPGNSTEPVNPELLVYFYSGSFCLDEVYPEFQNADPHMQVDDCQERAKSYYGSTSQFPPTFKNA